MLIPMPISKSVFSTDHGTGISLHGIQVHRVLSRQADMDFINKVHIQLNKRYVQPCHDFESLDEIESLKLKRTLFPGSYAVLLPMQVMQ